MQITTLKWTFLNYPSLNFSFYSHYDQFIPFREFPNCYNPLRIQIDINLVLTSVMYVSIFFMSLFPIQVTTYCPVLSWVPSPPMRRMLPSTAPSPSPTASVVLASSFSIALAMNRLELKTVLENHDFKKMKLNHISQTLTVPLRCEECL